MNILKRIILRLLYLTPFGYFLSTIILLSGKKTPGISVELNRYSPIRANIKKKATPNERINWLINGMSLLIEGWFVMFKEIAGDTGITFALIAFIFGLTNLVAAFFPSIQFKKKIF